MWLRHQKEETGGSTCLLSVSGSAKRALSLIVVAFHYKSFLRDFLKLNVELLVLSTLVWSSRKHTHTHTNLGTTKNRIYSPVYLSWDPVNTASCAYVKCFCACHVMETGWRRVRISTRDGSSGHLQTQALVLSWTAHSSTFGQAATRRYHDCRHRGQWSIIVARYLQENGHLLPTLSS
jgi:hypothetical protein